MKFNYWRIVLFLAIAFVCVAGIFFVWQKYIVQSQTPSSGGSGYQAVFLDNGQVYFGKIISIKNGYIDLSDVYYISNSNQNAAAPSASGASISLVKLGNEIHGPTTEMFIAQNHVLFYENLRPDSKVVESIATTTK